MAQNVELADRPRIWRLAASGSYVAAFFGIMAFKQTALGGLVKPG